LKASPISCENTRTWEDDDVRTLLIVIVGLVVAAGGVARAVTCVDDDCVFNNGLAPPEPDNVINDSSYVGDNVYVRNFGCPPGWPAAGPFDPCPSPGAPTEVALADGGTMLFLFALDSSTITMNGGTVGYDVRAFDSSTITISGGTASYALYTFDSSVITIVGSDFEVDGMPVPYGNLAAQTGTLTGTLASDDPMDNLFYQGGGNWTGTITLVPVPEPGELLLLVSGGVGLLGLAAWRRRVT
jgi:hypothetical protein